jgi:hypothetical protein
MDIEDIYYKKYLKYKTKYLELKLNGGSKAVREEHNENYYSHINIIDVLLRQIFNSLVPPEDIPKDIPKDISKNIPKTNWEKLRSVFSRTKTSTDTSTKTSTDTSTDTSTKTSTNTSTKTSDDVLKSIKKDLIDAWIKYYDFHISLSTGKSRDTFEDYRQGNKTKISELETEIKNKIRSIIDQRHLHSYGKIINVKLKSFNEVELKNLLHILNINEIESSTDEVGLKLLQKILDYYFKKIFEAIDNAIPKWRKENSDRSYWDGLNKKK